MTNNYSYSKNEFKLEDGVLYEDFCELWVPIADKVHKSCNTLEKALEWYKDVTSCRTDKDADALITKYPKNLET